MDIRRRPPRPQQQQTTAQNMGTHHHTQSGRSSSSGAMDDRSLSPTPRASDALPLLLYLMNTVFFTLFFSAAYFLLYRWRNKIRNSTPLHMVTLFEITAIVSLIASFIYLLGFFGINFVQLFISRASHDTWDLDDPHHLNFLVDDRTPCIAPPLPKLSDPEVVIPTLSFEEDKEIINSVVGGTILLYLLESRLGDCKQAASIRREALQKTQYSGKQSRG